MPQIDGVSAGVSAYLLGGGLAVMTLAANMAAPHQAGRRERVGLVALVAVFALWPLVVAAWCVNAWRDR